MVRYITSKYNSGSSTANSCSFEHVIAEDLSAIISHILLKPSAFLLTYHKVQHSKILHGARFALSVLYGSQNKQRLLFYTSLTDWFL